MNKPFFSVIILTYNRPEFLKEAIQSVLDQSYKDFELIIIDDRSTDNTKDVVASYKDGRIRYFLNDRAKGQPGARNAGLSHSSGEWVTFLDDDDIWLPLKLEKQYHKIQEVDETVGLVYTGYAEYDFESKKELSEFIPEKEGWIKSDLLYNNCIGAICSVAVRKELLKQVGGFDERFQSMVDMDMWVRVTSLASVVSIKEKLVYIRKSNSDRISLDLKRKLQGILLFQSKYYDLIKKDPKLMHRISSLIFLYALKQKKWSIIFKAIPWTMGGVLFDIRNLLQISWGTILFLCQRKD